MAATKNQNLNLGPRRRPSIRQKLRSLFKKKSGSKLRPLSTIQSPRRSSSDLGSTQFVRSDGKQQKRASLVRKESGAPMNLSIADQFMGGGSLMGLEFEKGGLDDLKLSFETGDGIDSWLSPKKDLQNPLALPADIPELDGGDMPGETFLNFTSFLSCWRSQTNYLPSGLQLQKTRPTQHNNKTEFQNYPKPKNLKLRSTDNSDRSAEPVLTLPRRKSPKPLRRSTRTRSHASHWGTRMRMLARGPRLRARGSPWMRTGGTLLAQM
jgi:hypothetical protein